MADKTITMMNHWCALNSTYRDRQVWFFNIKKIYKSRSKAIDIALLNQYFYI